MKKTHWQQSLPIKTHDIHIQERSGLLLTIFELVNCHRKHELLDDNIAQSDERESKTHTREKTNKKKTKNNSTRKNAKLSKTLSDNNNNSNRQNEENISQREYAHVIFLIFVKCLRINYWCKSKIFHGSVFWEPCDIQSSES